MNSTQIIGGLVTLVFVALCMLPGFLKRAKMRRVRTEYHKAKTTIVAREEFWANDYERRDSAFEHYKLKFEYVVDGKAYYHEAKWFERNLPSPSMFDAYYDPRDPRKVYLESEIRDSWVPFAIGGLFSVMAIVIYCAVAGWF